LLVYKIVGINVGISGFLFNLSSWYLERDGFRLNRRGFPNQEVSDSTCWLGRRLA
jgi:hypothetical protein